MELASMVEQVFQAAQYNDVSRLQELLKSHPSLANTENSDGLTPLGYAAHFGSKGAVQALLDYGAEVNAISHSMVSYIPSNTALHAAIAGERSEEVINLLLAHQANTNLFDSNGHTSLHSAAYHTDNVELIRLFIEHGADVHAAVEGGDTVLSLAVQQGNHQVVEWLRDNGAAR